MGLVKRALAATRPSCGDDADFFFAMLFLACVNYQQRHNTHIATDALPPIFIVNDTIRIRGHVGIFKNP